MPRKPPPAEKRFKKGKSGNPKGRPPTKTLIRLLRDIASEPAFEGKPEKWHDVITRSFLMTAADRRHPDHMTAVALYYAYIEGKPRDRVELSGPGGSPIAFDGPINGVADLTSQQQRRKLDQLRAERDRILAQEAEYVVKKVTAAVLADQPEPLVMAGAGPGTDEDGSQ